MDLFPGHFAETIAIHFITAFQNGIARISVQNVMMHSLTRDNIMNHGQVSKATLTSLTVVKFRNSPNAP